MVMRMPLAAAAAWLAVLTAPLPGAKPKGDAPMPLSPQAIDARIQKHRTAEVVLTITGPDGKPRAGREVTVRQVRHKFLFGCNAFGIAPADKTPAQLAYQKRYAELLNYATLPFYWGAYEGELGKPQADRLRAMAQWCRDRGIRAKGHPLCWHQVVPKWAYDKSLDELGRLQVGRVGREVKGFAGLIDTWDVVNEAVIMPTFQADKNPVTKLCNQLGRVELLKRTFDAARKANAKATLLLNDYETSEAYAKLIAECLAAGVPIDVVGIQSHMHGGYRGATWAWETCERFAKFGKPLHFTELTIQSGEVKKDIRWNGPYYDDWHSTPDAEKRQAQQVAEFYTVLFSHPAVEGITWWDFSDDRAWLGAPSGLVRKDMSPKPAYEELIKLVKGKWWTGERKLTTDSAGCVRFRGYLGDYEVIAGEAKAAVRVDTAGKADATAKL